MSIHKQVTLSATPSDVYEVLVDADRLSSLSAMSGVAGVAPGDEFSAFDAHVVGRQIEFAESERIVQTSSSVPPPISLSEKRTSE
jgi:activator of HSP90 ATPase